MLLKLSTTSKHDGVELGVVSGSIVKSRFFIKDIFAGFRKFFGMELVEYSEMVKEAREEATKRMIAEAETLGATGIVNVRFTTSMITSQAAEVLAYGTAVKEE